MPVNDVNTSLIVIRLLAAVLFIVFFSSSREPRHLALSAGWFVYAVSGIFRVFVENDPSLYWELAGTTGAGGLGVVLLSAIAYLRPSVLKASIPLLLITFGRVLVLFMTRGPFGIQYLLYFIQAVLLTVTIGYYVRLRSEARKIFPGASLFLITVLLLSVIYTILVALVDFPLFFKGLGTAIINAAFVSFFVYSEHHLVLQKVQRTEQRLQRAEESVGIGIWERSGVNGDARWSGGHYRIFGLPVRSGPVPSWEEYLDLVYPEDRAAVRESFHRAVTDGSIPAISYRIVRPDGTIRWVSAQAETGDENEVFGIVIDITDIKATETKLSKILREKETLLAELHHRVKNNLQIISSMLRLQFDGFEDPRIDSVVTRIENRLQAMSAVQELLLEMQDLSEIEMDEYIGRLSDTIGRAHASSYGLITIHLDTSGIQLEASTAVVIGFIVTELLSNALEHAFQRGEAGVVGIELRYHNDGYTLTVTDNGTGFSATGRESSGLGLKLVESFVSQINGTFTIGENNGCHAEVRFPDRVTNTSSSNVAAG